MLSAEHLDVRLGHGGDARRVVHGVRLTVDPGSILGILGPNGAGKSTLLRALAGLIPHHGGTVQLDGRSLAAWSDGERSRRLGYVPQRSELRSGLSVRRVVELSRYAHRGPLAPWTREDRDAVQVALRETDADRLADRPFTELSEGERRRVLIARALASGARCLLLDEPTAALDVSHALNLFDVLRELRGKGYAIAVVLHDLNEAHQLVDRAVVLAAGRTVASGARDAVFTPDVVRSAFGVELVERGAFGYARPERA
mgnify:CR=1 FL=1